MKQAVRDKFHDPRTMQLCAEAAVVTRDGSLLGTVARVDGIYFQVEPASGHKFWLSADQVLSSDGPMVELTVTSDEVVDFQRSRPGGEAWEPPSLDALQDGLLSETEQRHQRERMEQELRAQTRNLPHHTPPEGSVGHDESNSEW